jgi:signal transduction histidine kinase
MYNLVNNAIPETPSGGKVSISTYAVPHGEWPEAALVGIEVADTGRGMPPEVKDKLFTDNAISTKPGGTGLGTRIVKNVVDVHHGTIGVESELGAGTTFKIKLPLNQP